MNWLEIQEYVYYQDGSLRDIYIRNVSRHDWKEVVVHLNSRYDLDFEVGESSRSKEITFDTLEKYWEGLLSESLSATIRIDSIVVKTYFFSDEEMEFDIVPREVDTLQKHNALLAFLMGLSNAVGKTVELTDETSDESKQVLLSVTGNHVTLTKGQSL